MSGKVDREIRRIVIDWLQFGDEMDENLAQNALTFISNTEKECNRYKQALEDIANAHKHKLDPGPWAITRASEAL